MNITKIAIASLVNDSVIMCDKIVNVEENISHSILSIKKQLIKTKMIETKKHIIILIYCSINIYNNW